ncbi:hypothetical protein LCGC14_2471900 [marine sediment metagenome]|uniref:Uncharacterized protein n=1 Tax=marine sediment metagenome TaxID=412755 RepID=A0A0F9BA36_9ZZZZ
MTPKREQWRLPKAFQPDQKVNETRQRHDGEPRIYDLVKHANDRSLSADTFIECCGCGLTHHNTFNVMKTPDGKWYLMLRAYRVPGTGSPSPGD